MSSQVSQVDGRISPLVGDHWNRVGRLLRNGAGPVRDLGEGIWTSGQRGGCRADTSW